MSGFTALMVVCVAFWSGIEASAAQKFVDGQVIVRFAGSADAARAKKEFASVRPLIPSLNLYLVKLKDRAGVETTVRNLVRRNDVLYAQPDHLVTLRETTPDDSDFDQQWSLKNDKKKGADIGAPLAWDLGTGGKDRDGNDIVIAIVDGGMDINHKDLSANLWVNTGEVPENGIDDEGNGYIDDVNGWNAYNGTGKIPAHPHGTHVAGIAGASGNNGTGIAGVNWKVKLMPVAASSGTTSVIAAGYGYVIAQKKLWLESKGAKGANIVVTNSSFGVDNADCTSSEYTVWNDLYNEMGKLGILSAAATANANVDIDKVGDVPTGCPSEFLIKVTNTDSEDKKYKNAGYGKKSIDLGSPGTKIHSTIPGDKYGPMTGTSMATPHVTGAVALLHSVGSTEFSSKVSGDPAEGARAVKAALLGNTQPLESLADVTVTGGRLNLAAAAKAISIYK